MAGSVYVEVCDRGAAGVEAGRAAEGAALQSASPTRVSARLLDWAGRRPRPATRLQGRDCTSGELKNASCERSAWNKTVGRRTTAGVGPQT